MTQSKYGNKRCERDGFTFDSLAERKRYDELRLMEKAGEVTMLQVHPSWLLHTIGRGGLYAIVAKYVADFSYYDFTKHTTVVEDVKGTRTALYKLKRKWMLAEWDIDVVEVEA